MTTHRQTTTPAAATAREALVGLHAALLAHARRAHERGEGRTTSAAFLQLAAHDPALAWVGVLSGLIVRLDTAGDARPVLAEAAGLLRGAGGGEFATRYLAAIQDSPDVAVAGARARKALGG